MPITDLTGATWVGNNRVEIEYNETYNFSFICNNVSYSSIEMSENHDIPTLWYDDVAVAEGPNIYVLEWIDDAYKTIQITGGTDATNSTLIAWLEANGTLIAPIQANTYNLTHTLTNLSKGNITLQITPDTNYTYPTSLTISNGTIVSYDNTTGVAVISGDDTTIVSGECVEQASGYSGNITLYNYPIQSSVATAIKFDTPPSSPTDYDAYVDTIGREFGLTSYTNKTKVYVWSPIAVSSIISINGNQYNGSSTYQSAVEITLTGDYNIALIYNYFSME